MRKFLLALPLLALSLNGCAALGTVNHFLTSQKNPVLQEAAVAALATAIGQIGGDPKATAANVKAIALRVQADAANPTATVQALEATLNQEIARISPNPAQAAAFTALAGGLELALNAYIATNPGGPVASTTLVSIQGLCAAVVIATGLYGV